ncbi:hypothetical protein MMC17_004266 [Xylographa soralifera]|nr:hypothetical protein [Xylographa soralifera]
MPSCYCGRGFRDLASLIQHKEAKNHGYCCHCDRVFNSADAYDQHCSALHSFRCGTCQRNFAFATALRLHQEDTGHAHCRDCDRTFGSTEALDQHLKSSIHASHFHCCDCDRDFGGNDALNQHLTDKVHKPKKDAQPAPASDSSLSCQQCDKTFTDEIALRQHLSSVVHHPLSNICCPGDKSCKKRFTSPSAAVHHLESGACRSGITRKSLNALIQSNDVDQLIHNSSEGLDTPSLYWNDNASTSSFGGGVPILTPQTNGSITSTPLSASLLSGLLTPTSSGPDDYGSDLALAASPSCPLCPKTFRSLGALQDHIASPAHASKIFHCPLSFTAPLLDDAHATKVTKLFSTLSGLTQHLESGACVGGSGMWRSVMKYVEERARQNGWKNLRLSD